MILSVSLLSVCVGCRCLMSRLVLLMVVGCGGRLSLRVMWDVLCVGLVLVRVGVLIGLVVPLGVLGVVLGRVVLLGFLVVCGMSLVVWSLLFSCCLRRFWVVLFLNCLWRWGVMCCVR